MQAAAPSSGLLFLSDLDLRALLQLVLVLKLVVVRYRETVKRRLESSSAGATAPFFAP